MSEVKELEIVQENALIINPEEYGLSEKKTELITEQFKPIISSFNEIKEDYDKIMSSDEITEDIAKKARAVRLKYVKIRTGSDKILKEVKDIFYDKVKIIDSNRRSIKDQISEAESNLLEKETYFERLEMERIASIQKERETELLKYEVDGLYMDLGNMPEDVWLNYLSGVKLAYQQKIEAEKKAEEERLRKESIEKLNKERKDLVLPYWNFLTEQSKGLNFGELDDFVFEKILLDAKSSKEKFDEEQEKIRLENERLKKEAEEKAREQERIEAERLAKEEEGRKIREEKERKEREAYEAKLKAEREEKERIEIEERKKREKLEAELKAKEEAERIRIEEVERKKLEAEKAAKEKELAPDKDKLIELSKNIGNFNLPNLQSSEAINILNNVSGLLKKIELYITKSVEKL